MKGARLQREVASASHGQRGATKPGREYNAADRRKAIARCARTIEQLKARRRKMQKQLDAINDSITIEKRMYRDLIADAVEPPLDTPMPTIDGAG